MDIESNPYRSPTALEPAAYGADLTRADALFRFRVAMTLLLLAAAVNGFYLLRLAPGQIGAKFPLLVVDILFLAFVGLLVMTGAFPTLEGITKFLQRIIAPRSDPEAWNNSIYNAFRPAIPLGLLGALLWITWVIAFFELKANFYVISYAIGLPAHLLAACIYLPLIYGWYKAAQTTSKKPKTPIEGELTHLGRKT